MDWFEHLLGSLENPQFRFDYVSAGISHIDSPSRRNTKLAHELDVDDGWSGWVGMDRGNYRRYVHGKVIAPDYDVLIQTPCQSGFPVDISITNHRDCYSMDVFFVDSMRPHHTKISVNENHRIEEITYYIPNKSKRSCLFFTKGPSRAIDVFSTSFINDDILLMEWNALMNKRDMDGIKDFLIEHGNNIRYGSFT